MVPSAFTVRAPDVRIEHRRAAITRFENDGQER